MAKSTKTNPLKVVPSQQPAVIQTEEASYFLDYGRAATGSSIIGMLLKFNKGDWVAGQDNEELEDGTTLIANMDSLTVGWQRWEDGRPAEQVMGQLVKGFVPPRRNELSFNDPNEWERDESNGKPRDPWVYTHQMVMKEPGKKGQLYTFTSSSGGGKTAIGKLSTAYGDGIRGEHAGEYPIVELSKGSYLHRDPSLGRIKVPELPVVGWADRSEFDEVVEAVTPSSRKKIK